VETRGHLLNKGDSEVP